MILSAALIGIGAGAIATFTMFHVGMLSERSGAAVLLAAIAFFYPVFAAQEGDIAALVLHAIIFAGFAGLAGFGFQRGMHLIAGGLIAHGIFDIGLHFLDGPGPRWWPIFCAAIDITCGAILVRLLQTRKVAQ